MMVVAWVGLVFWNRGLSMGSYLRHEWWIPSAVSLSVKPALHRSVVFWLGCFVLLFLVWAWADSRKTVTSASRMSLLITPGAPFGDFHGVYLDRVALDGGRILVWWSHATITSSTLHLDSHSMGYMRGPRDAEGVWFAKPTVVRHVDENTAGARVMTYFVEVPMWCVVALYLMGCGGVLVWRRRRWRKVLLDRERTGMEGVNA